MEVWGFLFGVDNRGQEVMKFSLKAQGRDWNILQRALPYRVLSQFLASKVWPLSCSLPLSACVFLSLGLARQGLSVLMLAVMFLSSGSTPAELNKVTSNLCLQPPPWGESPASWHSPAEHTLFPASPGRLAAWQGPRGRPAAWPTCPSTPGHPALDHECGAPPSTLDTG